MLGDLINVLLLQSTFELHKKVVDIKTCVLTWPSYTAKQTHIQHEKLERFQILIGFQRKVCPH